MNWMMGVGLYLILVGMFMGIFGISTELNKKVDISKDDNFFMVSKGSRIYTATLPPEYTVNKKPVSILCFEQSESELAKIDSIAASMELPKVNEGEK